VLGTYGPTLLPSPWLLLKCTCAPPQYRKQGRPCRHWKYTAKHEMELCFLRQLDASFTSERAEAHNVRATLL
jgi:hypothetical protein